MTRKFKNRKIPIKFGMVLSAFAATTTLLSIEACAEPGTPEHAALSTFATWYGKLYREFDTNGHPTEKTVSQFVDSLVDFLTAINAGNVLINSIQKIGLSLPTLWGASSN